MTDVPVNKQADDYSHSQQENNGSLKFSIKQIFILYQPSYIATSFHCFGTPFRPRDMIFDS